MPARSLRTTFSPISACAPTWARSSWSRSRLAVLSLALWQTTQYLSTTARSVVAVEGAVWAARAADMAKPITGSLFFNGPSSRTLRYVSLLLPERCRDDFIIGLDGRG